MATFYGSLLWPVKNFVVVANAVNANATASGVINKHFLSSNSIFLKVFFQRWGGRTVMWPAADRLMGVRLSPPVFLGDLNVKKDNRKHDRHSGYLDLILI